MPSVAAQADTLPPASRSSTAPESPMWCVRWRARTIAVAFPCPDERVLLRRHFDLPSAHEPRQNLFRLHRLVGTQESLCLECLLRIAHQYPAQRHDRQAAGLDEMAVARAYRIAVNTPGGDLRAAVAVRGPTVRIAPVSNTCTIGQARLENRSENPAMTFVSLYGMVIVMNISARSR